MFSLTTGAITWIVENPVGREFFLVKPASCILYWNENT